eukprot:1402156-Lingulodinium_polyedra.AAC.1
MGGWRRPPLAQERRRGLQLPGHGAAGRPGAAPVRPMAPKRPRRGRRVRRLPPVGRRAVAGQPPASAEAGGPHAAPPEA